MKTRLPNPTRRTLGRLAGTILAFALCAPLAVAGEADWAAIDRWLEGAETGVAQDFRAPGPSPLAALGRLQREHAARQAEFRDVASRPLPPKALARLAEVEAAWEAGQGRLVELLRQLREDLRSEDPGAPALAAEAHEILARLRAAARRQPLSAELKLRAPVLRPPALPGRAPARDLVVGAAGRPQDDVAAALSAADAAPIGQIPSRLKDVAAQLGGPLETYEWVRNAVAPELYYGVMKGPLQTYLEASGNDADTAGLLIALLRAQGVPARYASGRVRVSAARLMALTGTATAELAVRALERAGIPHETELGVGSIGTVSLARVWVEAYLPYVNYRGAAVDTQGKVWVPLDAGFRPLAPPSGVDVVATLGVDPEALTDEYLAGPPASTPLELVRQRVSALAAAQGLAYEDVLNDRAFLAERLGILPNTLPYQVESRPVVGFDPPEDLAHGVRVRGSRAGVTLIDAELKTPEVLGRRFTLGYVPFDASDAATVESFGSLALTPPYLIELKPVLKVDGVTVAAGNGAVGAGVAFDLRVELVHPGGVESIENQVLAGNLTAIGLGGRDPGGAEAGADHAAAILSRLAWKYLDRWNHSDEELANLLRVAPVRPTVSACMVMSAIEVDYADGDPLYPATFEWKGLAMDADLRSSAPVGIEAVEAERGFLLLSGLEGSVLENRIFEDEIEIEAVSTARALQLAPAQGVNVLDLTSAEVETVLPGLPLDPLVQEEIREAGLRGYTVRVPVADVSRLAWTGVGYRILDPETGEAAWQLQGGHSGGVTAPSTLDWPSHLVELLTDQGEEPAPPGSDVAFIRKFGSTDYQDGYVGDVLETPLKVLVTDIEGQRVPGAPVRFNVVGGGGWLVDPIAGAISGQSLTVFSNERGEAEAYLVLGESTDLIPRYTCLEPTGCSSEEQVYATQVGLNLVSARSGNAVLSEPFYAYGRPDDRGEEPGGRQAFLAIVKYPQPPGGASMLEVAGLTSVLVLDPYGNAVSNFPVQFSFAPPPTLGSPASPWVPARPATSTSGLVLGLRDFLLCTERSSTYFYGDCAGEASSVVVPSSTLGSFAYPITADSQYTIYYFNVGTPEQPDGLRFGVGTRGQLCYGSCSEGPLQPQTWAQVGTPPRLVNAFGNLIEAYRPGSEVPLDLTTSVVYEGYTLFKFVDEDGVEQFRVHGNNVFTRERLVNADVFVDQVTPGSAITSPQAVNLGNGVHESGLVLSSVPALNTASVRAHMYPDRFPYSEWPNLDKSRVHWEARKVDKIQYCEAGSSFPPGCRPRAQRISVLTAVERWGVRPTITEIVPSTLRLRDGVTAQESEVHHTVEPPAYLARLDPTDLRFDLQRGGENLLSANGTDGSPYTIPPGLALLPDDYTAYLTVRGVTPTDSGVGDIVSDPVRVSACNQLELLTPRVSLGWSEDAPPESRCASDRIVFELCEDSLVTVSVAGVVFPALVDGQEATPSDLQLGPGRHQVQLPPDLLAAVGAESAPFQVRAVTVQAPVSTVTEAGIVRWSDLLVDLETPVIQEKVIFDPDNQTTCSAGPRPIRFNLCTTAAVTLEVDRSVLTARVDGVEQTLQDLVLSPGRHYVELPWDVLTEGYDVEKPFTVAAQAVSDPERRGLEPGLIVREVENRSMLQVGHTFVKGVDVFDGHVVVQERDVDLPGRHLGLGVTRSYSSAGQKRDGFLGAGWSWNYESSLTINRDCGLYALRTADGSSQVFRRAPVGPGFVPQKGYHGRLEEVGDGFDYYDKANIRHHFSLRPPGQGIPGNEYRLESMEEPHGDRIVLEWDSSGRIVGVAEMHGDQPVRRLVATYQWIGGFDRITSIETFSGEEPLKTRLEYAYDDLGNLVRATRFGRNIEGPRAEDRVHRYTYSIDDARDRHQLREVKDPNGHIVRYDYYLRTDPFPGQETGFLYVMQKEEFVKRVLEFPKGAQATSFSYDFTKAISLGEWHTVVTDPRGFDTRFVQNGLGASRRVVEAEGEDEERTTQIEWKPNDVLKDWELDAKNRRTNFEYDDNGNLTSEIIVTADFGPVETKYLYHPTFNKLTLKEDAEKRQTIYTLDGDTGDLTSMLDVEGNLTRYGYTGGLLTSETSPRGYTTVYQDHDSFGNPRTIVDALGNRTDREYDARGRLQRETDSLGRVTEYEYDGLDRPTLVQRVAGDGSDDEITRTEYHPNGEPRRVTNPNGAVTFFALDGLNRVKQTDTYFDAEHLTTLVEYDGNGNKWKETDRRGVQRRFAYDPLNQLTGVFIDEGPAPAPMGQVAEFGYDEVGNRTREVDHLGNETRLFYDDLYRVETRKLPEPNPATGLPYEESYGYDLAGNRTSFSDANGKVTEYDYDGLDRLVETRRDAQGLNLRTTSTYDDPEGLSKVNKAEDYDAQRGLRTLYEYDELDREKKRTVRLEGEDGDPTNGVVEYVTFTDYDDAAHSMTVTDPRGTLITTRLGGLDRVVEEVVDDRPGGLRLTTLTEYDGLGNRKRVIDPRGNDTLYRHDGLGRLVTVTDADRKVTRYGYDGEALKVREEDRRGVATHYTYDNLGRQTLAELEPSITGVGWSQATQYLDPQRQRMETDARGKRTTYHLDGMGRVVKVTDHLLNFMEMRYDGVNKRGESNKRGNWTTFEYDAVNRLRKTTDPPPFQDQAYLVDYDDTANRVIETDRRGTVKTTQLDALGRVASITRAGVALERNEYDGNDNRIRMLDAEDREIRLEYDEANRLVRRVEAPGTPIEGVTRYILDANGNIEEERDPRTAALGEEYTIKRMFDRLNQVTAETDGEGFTAEYDYDEEGNRTLHRDPRKNETQYEHDELGKLVKVTQPEVPTAAGGPSQPVTEYVYDRVRNLERQTDAETHVVSMTYDDMNRLETRTQDPDGLDLVTRYDYDPDGREEVVTDAKGQTTTSTYDELGRLATKTFAFNAADPERPWRHTTGIVYGYDENNNLVQIDESVASGTDPPETLTTRRPHTPLDRLEFEETTLPDIPTTGPRTRRVDYTYYDNGLRETVTSPDSGTTTYFYDERNRLAVTRAADGTETRHTYYPDSLLQDVTSPNGVVAHHEYDLADRLEGITNLRGATTISAYRYFYDENGNRKRQVETNGGVSEETTYDYDALNRLESIVYPVDSEFPGGRTVTYEYDKVGNRWFERIRNTATGVPLEVRAAGFDNANRLQTLQDSSGTTSFGYDANGNQTTRSVGPVTTLYRYDIRNKMVEVEQGTSILGRYQYDFLGRRTKKVGDSGNTLFVYDDSSTFLEYDGDGTLRARYDYGTDRLISLTRAGARRYYSFDGLRSVVNLTDESGSATASYHLDAWGNLRFPAELQASPNRFAFTGHYFDTETNLYQAKARYFDPKLGRFLSQDSLLGELDQPPSLHRYAYVQNRPTYFRDPDGLWIESAWDAFSLGVGVVSLVNNVREGNWGDAALDAVGVIADGAALALPIVPGGVGAAIKASRAVKVGVDALQAVDTGIAVGQGLGATAEAIAEGKPASAALNAGLTVVGAAGISRTAGNLADDIADVAGDARRASRAAGAAAHASPNMTPGQRAQRRLESPQGETATPNARSRQTTDAPGARTEVDAPPPTKHSADPTGEPVVSPRRHGTPFTQLTPTQRRTLKAKEANRTLTREEYRHLQWDRRFGNRRDRGVARFWGAERRRLRAGEPGTRNWTADQREAILNSRNGRPKFDGETLEGHHRFDASSYPQLADDPTIIYPATRREHLLRWHGGDFKNEVAGAPLDLSFPEEF